MTKNCSKTKSDELVIMELEHWNFFSSLYISFFFNHFVKIIDLEVF